MKPPHSPLEATLQILRDLSHGTARRLGKEIRFHVTSVITVYRGPDLSRVGEVLTQVIQNAVDHGIESPEVRQKCGKDPTGNLWLHFSESEHAVVITLRDDGAGVNIAAVRRKAIALGLLEEGREAPVSETLSVLFQPGFSTKKTVTEVSGRGIGLEIVRSTTEALAGAAEVDTVQGKGTTFTLRFPAEKRSLAA